jgi:hypothetical protein
VKTLTHGNGERSANDHVCRGSRISDIDEKPNNTSAGLKPSFFRLDGTTKNRALTRINF